MGLHQTSKKYMSNYAYLAATIIYIIAICYCVICIRRLNKTISRLDELKRSIHDIEERSRELLAHLKARRLIEPCYFPGYVYSNYETDEPTLIYEIAILKKNLTLLNEHLNVEVKHIEAKDVLIQKEVEK